MKAYNICSSHVVTHPNAVQARHSLTSVIRQELVYSVCPTRSRDQLSPDHLHIRSTPTRSSSHQVNSHQIIFTSSTPTGSSSRVQLLPDLLHEFNSHQIIFTSSTPTRSSSRVQLPPDHLHEFNSHQIIFTSSTLTRSSSRVQLASDHLHEFNSHQIIFT